jgi:hypothetical protein
VAGVGTLSWTSLRRDGRGGGERPAVERISCPAFRCLGFSIVRPEKSRVCKCTVSNNRVQSVEAIERPSALLTSGQSGPASQQADSM